MLANAGVNINDSVQVRNYLNGYYNRNYSYAAYSQVLRGCANQTLNYVLALPGIEAEEAKEGYRYGFQGQENVNEIYGDGNAYDFGARIYDSRLGRNFSQDVYNSLAYPFLSPYNGMANNPIANVDVEGKLIIYFNGFWPLKGSTAHLDAHNAWDVELTANSAIAFNDHNAMFFNGSSSTLAGAVDWLVGIGSGAGTTARSRAKKGYGMGMQMAKKIREALDEEKRTGCGPAKITSIAHSMGAAYSQGFMEALHAAVDENGKPMFSDGEFDTWVAFAPYQADKLTAPPFFSKTYQFNSSYDGIAGNIRIHNVKVFVSEPNGGKPSRGKFNIGNAKSHLLTNFRDKLKPRKNTNKEKVHPIYSPRFL